MPLPRLLVYLMLAAWFGGAGVAWSVNLHDRAWFGMVATTVVQAGVVAALAVMGVRDWRRGRVVDADEAVTHERSWQ